MGGGVHSMSYKMKSSEKAEKGRSTVGLMKKIAMSLQQSCIGSFHVGHRGIQMRKFNCRG